MNKKVFKYGTPEPRLTMLWGLKAGSIARKSHTKDVVVLQIPTKEKP